MTLSSNLVSEIVECDVLVVGGGLAGSFAAIAARKNGSNVVISEKAHIRRSGDAHLGTDHASLFSEDPDISPVSPSKEAELIKTKPFVDSRLPYEEIFAETYDRILDLEQMGCKVRRPNGEFIRTPGVWPGGIITMAVDQKLNLSREIKRLGIKVYNRTMVTKLLTHQSTIAGAIGVNVRDGSFILFRAKSVVITTGKAIRIYPQHGRALLGGFGAMGLSPSSSGDGHAMAYHAGARIINMEFTRGAPPLRHPRLWSSSGSMGHSRPADAPPPTVDAAGKKLYGNVSYKGRPELAQDYNFGTGPGNPLAYEAVKAGRYPLYYDLTSWPDYNHRLFTLGNACESPITLKYMTQSGIDWRTHQIELHNERNFRSLELGLSGVKVDGECMSFINGLFAAGDAAGGTYYAWFQGSITLGHRAGRFAAVHAQNSKLAPISEEDVATEKHRIFEPLNGQGTIPWEELEKTIQYIMKDWVGMPCKVDASIERGLELLAELRQKLIPKLQATNFHELMRCLEQHNILDVAVMHATSMLTRKETRFGFRHTRADYPEADDTNWLDKLVVIQKDQDQMRIRAMKPTEI